VICTYRLQLGPDLGLDGARALVPYLKELGVSHLYLSPIWQARAGSTHGYDVVDPTRVSADLGGEGALRRLAGAGLGLVLDVVPNHMARDEANPYWTDPTRRARFFDLDRQTGRHRRFFDVDDLVGVRQEDPEVFAVTHALVLRLAREGVADGLRVDHPDGLADPAGYLGRLRAGGAGRVWVEKILERGERLRDWPVEGTTGYEFLSLATAAFVDPAAEAPLSELYARLTGRRRPFSEVARAAKREQAATTFRPEVERLQRLLPEPRMADALAALAVYRTYVEPWSGGVAPEDRAALAEAPLPDGVRRALLLEERGREDFVTRFQQTTGAVMAKGVEDTALYRYARLLALNEVGSDPERFGAGPEELHRASLLRASRFPRNLLPTQTHDTKRSADVRARLAALSEDPAAWAERVGRWRAMATGLREGGAPDANEEYLIFQTIVGAWPLSEDRLVGYVGKALREEKTNTSWVDQDADWERRVIAYCRGVLGDRGLVRDLAAFAGVLARRAERAVLGQVLLKLVSPGVPDVYQGDELADLSLVDPDNRRPVDWEVRRRSLAEVRRGAPPTGELAKLALLALGLELRARRPAALLDAAYIPLDAGPDVWAAARGDAVLAAVALRARGVDAEVALTAHLSGRWRHVVTGRRVSLGRRVAVSELTGDFPVALLERADDA